MPPKPCFLEGPKESPSLVAWLSLGTDTEREGGRQSQRAHVKGGRTIGFGSSSAGLGYTSLCGHASQDSILCFPSGPSLQVGAFFCNSRSSVYSLCIRVEVVVAAAALHSHVDTPMLSLGVKSFGKGNAIENQTGGWGRDNEPLTHLTEPDDIIKVPVYVSWTLVTKATYQGAQLAAPLGSWR